MPSSYRRAAAFCAEDIGGTDSLIPLPRNLYTSGPTSPNSTRFALSPQWQGRYSHGMARITDAALSLRLRKLISSGRARELRTTAGDTLAAAGRIVEVDPAAVLHWERGRMPRGRNVRAYYRYLARLEAAAQGTGDGGEAA